MATTQNTNNDPAQRFAGVHPVIAGIMQLLSQVALGGATKGASVLEQQKMTEAAKEQQQQNELQIALANVERGQQLPSSVSPNSLGLDQGGMSMLNQIPAAQRAQASAIAKMFPQLAGLAQIPGGADLLTKALPGMITEGTKFENEKELAGIKAGYSQGLEKQRETAAAGRQQAAFGEAQKLQGEREAASTRAIKQRLQASKDLKLYGQKLKDQSATGTDYKNFLKGQNKTFTANLKITDTQQQADAMSAQVEDLLNSPVPLSHSLMAMPMQVQHKAGRIFGAAPASYAFGLDDAVKMAIRDTNNNKDNPQAYDLFIHDLQTSHDINAALTDMAQKGLITKEAASGLIVQIKNAMARKGGVSGLSETGSDAADSSVESSGDFGLNPDEGD